MYFFSPPFPFYLVTDLCVCACARGRACIYILLSPSRAMRPECIMCVSADRLKLLYINRSFGEREARSESVAYARRGGTREKRVCIHTQLARGRRVARVAGRSASFLCDRACGGDIPYDVIRDSRRWEANDRPHELRTMWRREGEREMGISWRRLNDSQSRIIYDVFFMVIGWVGSSICIFGYQRGSPRITWWPVFSTIFFFCRVVVWEKFSAA